MIRHLLKNSVTQIPRMALIGLCSIGLSGCAGFKLGDYLNSWEDFPTDLALSCKQKPNGFEASEAFLGPTPAGEGLPTPLANDKVARELVSLFQVPANIDVAAGAPVGFERGDDELVRTATFRLPAPDQTEIDLGDVQAFVERLTKSMPSRPLNADSVYSQKGLGFEAGGTGELTNGTIFLKYFMEYANKGFISRSGTKIQRPEVSLKIGSGIFGAATQIFVESQLDGLIGTPVLFEGDPDPKKRKQRKYLPKGAAVEPTAVSLGIVEAEPLLNPDESEFCGITKAEYKVMRTAAAAAADGGTMLTGILLETIGEFEVGFLLSADISIGDAETLPTIAKMLVQTSIEGAQEALLYKFFSNFSYARIGDGFESGESGPSVGEYQAIGVSISGFESAENRMSPQITNVLNLIRIADQNTKQIEEAGRN